MKKEKNIGADKIFFGIFGCVGIVFLFVTIILLSHFFTIQKNCDKVSATILDMNESPSYTEVEYTYEGSTYRVTLSMYSSSYYPGKRIEVYVDREAPYECVSLLSTYIVLFVFGMLGIVFSLIGFVGVFAEKKFFGLLPGTKESFGHAGDDDAGMNECFGNDSYGQKDAENLQKQNPYKSWSDEAGGR